jgi:hypothetical protein
MWKDGPQLMAVLGGNGTFRRWGLVEGTEVTEGVP